MFVSKWIAGTDDSLLVSYVMFPPWHQIISIEYLPAPLPAFSWMARGDLPLLLRPQGLCLTRRPPPGALAGSAPSGATEVGGAFCLLG